jgi:hypothetical protein
LVQRVMVRDDRQRADPSDIQEASLDGNVKNTRQLYAKLRCYYSWEVPFSVLLLKKSFRVMEGILPSSIIYS